jgi:hypothetical protein
VVGVNSSVGKLSEMVPNNQWLSEQLFKNTHSWLKSETKVL